MQTIYFVMFHAFKHGADDTVDLISMAAESITKIYPEALVVLLTNLPNDVTQLPQTIETRVIQVDIASLMLRRIEEYRAFLAEAPDECTIIFCDTDMLILRRFDELFDNDVDLTVTVRRSKRGRINGGFYVVSTRRKSATVAFFDRFVDSIKRLPTERAFWYGDQIAISELLRPPRLLHRPSLCRNVSGLRVRYVRVGRYNCSPRSLAVRLCLYPPLARVLHFKGRLKPHMSRYFRRYVAPRAHTSAMPGTDPRNKTGD